MRATQIDENSPAAQSLVVPTAPIWRLSVAQYHEMIRTGILTEDDPVELLEGWLVTKMPKNRRHSLSTQLTREALEQIIPSGWLGDAQQPITTADSEPEPDVVIVKGERRDYIDQHPRPEHVALVVEVSDATLQRDQTLKLRLYAHARIPIYWILNLQERQLTVYSVPTGEREQATYQNQVIYTEFDHVTVIIEGQEVGQIAVREVLS